MKELRRKGVPLGAEIPYQLDLAKAQENARNMIAKLKDGEGHHGHLRRRPGHAGVAHDGSDRAELLPRVGGARRGVHRHVAVRPAATTRSSGRTRSACRRCRRPSCPKRTSCTRSSSGSRARARPRRRSRCSCRRRSSSTPRSSSPARSSPRRRSATGCSASRPATTQPTQLHLSWGDHDIWPSTDFFGSDDATLDLVEPGRRGRRRGRQRRHRACGSTPGTGSATCPASGRRASPPSSTRTRRSRSSTTRAAGGPAAELPVAGQVGRVRSAGAAPPAPSPRRARTCG